jgi:hypothetical protein
MIPYRPTASTEAAMQREWRLFLVGAIVGSLLDLIHVVSGVLEYPHPFYPGGQAWWVPFLFGSAAVLLVKSYRPFVELFGATRTREPPLWAPRRSPRSETEIALTSSN